MFIMQMDEIWKEIAEDYIPDSNTIAEFCDYGSVKVIVVCYYDGGIPELTIGGGKTWIDAFARTGYLQGFIDCYSEEEIREKYDHLSEGELECIMKVVNDGFDYEEVAVKGVRG